MGWKFYIGPFIAMLLAIALTVYIIKKFLSNNKR